MKPFILLLSLFAAGCATLTHDSSQALHIDTVTSDGQPVKGANCVLANDFASVSAKSGSVVMIHRSSEDLAVTCASAGNANASGRLISRMNGGILGNVLIGGGIGALIDHNRGTAYTYPTWVQLVFGETRIYDRNSEKDGVALAGTLESYPTPIAASSSPAPVIERAASAEPDKISATPTK